MKRRHHLVAGMLILAGAAMAAPASAGVHVGIGIGVPGFYGTYAIRTGRCENPRFAYYHPNLCGYPRYSEPVFIDGAWIDEPLYYRTYGGSRYFWWHGGWRVGHGSWDGRHVDRIRFRDRDDRMRDRDDRMRDRTPDVDHDRDDRSH